MNQRLRNNIKSLLLSTLILSGCGFQYSIESTLENLELPSVGTPIENTPSSSFPPPPTMIDGKYGASADGGETDDPITNNITYTGEVYYVDCDSGNDLNDGLSPSSAWKTLAKVNSKTEVGYWDTVAANNKTNPPLHSPWTAAPDGSAFLLKRGCTFDGFLNLHAYISIGRYSDNITFGSYGDKTKSRPVVTYITQNSKFQGMVWTNGHTIHLRNIRFEANSLYPSIGLRVAATTGSTIENSEIHNASFDGILADDCRDLVIKNSIINNNSISGGRGGGLSASGTNIKVLNSTFSKNGRDKVGAHNIYIRHLHNSIIQGNILTEGSNHGVVLHGSSSNVNISQNQVFKNSNGIGVNGGYAEQETFDNIVIEKNIIRDNGFNLNEQGYAMLMNSMTNSVIKNNLVYNNRLGSLNISDGAFDDAQSTNVGIYYNVFYDPSSSLGSSIAGASLSQIYLKNNIFFSLSASYPCINKSINVPESALQLDYNLYFAPNNSSLKSITYNGTKYSPATLASGTGQESHGLYEDPLFIDKDKRDFHLQNTSPAIGQGTSVLVTDDFEGKLRSETQPNLGSYE